MKNFLFILSVGILSLGLINCATDLASLTKQPDTTEVISGTLGNNSFSIPASTFSGVSGTNVKIDAKELDQGAAESLLGDAGQAITLEGEGSKITSGASITVSDPASSSSNITLNNNVDITLDGSDVPTDALPAATASSLKDASVTLYWSIFCFSISGTTVKAIANTYKEGTNSTKVASFGKGEKVASGTTFMCFIAVYVKITVGSITGSTGGA